MSELPEKIGKYEIRSLLGEGGMGAVYEGFDLDIERRVAIKILHPHLISTKNGAEFLERFKREAKSAARCTHPNVVTVLEFGQDGELPYIVMEFVEGLSLEQIIKEKQSFDLQKIIVIVSKLLQALHYAHQLGIVHRDIKSANIMILKDNGDVKLADFGIARLTESPELTMAGAVVGTPKYMSPEQMFGFDVDARADLFSLAMVFLELLALLPKSTSIPRSSLPEITNLPPSNRINYSLLYPTALVPVLLKGLSVEQENRYQTAQAFSDAIQSVMPNINSATVALLDDEAIHSQQTTPIISASEDELKLMTDLLVEYIGPIARNIMIEYSNTSSIGDLASVVSEEISLIGERTDFLRRWEVISSNRIETRTQAMPDICSADTVIKPGGTKVDSFDDELLKILSDDYMIYIGPLADRLVGHYSTTTDSLKQLLTILADEIPDTQERQKFRDTWLGG